jgi:hypothetical protein
MNANSYFICSNSHCINVGNCMCGHMHRAAYIFGRFAHGELAQKSRIWSWPIDWGPSTSKLSRAAAQWRRRRRRRNRVPPTVVGSAKPIDYLPSTSNLSTRINRWCGQQSIYPTHLDPHRMRARGRRDSRP